jgi:hypothetical protein
MSMDKINDPRERMTERWFVLPLQATHSKLARDDCTKERMQLGHHYGCSRLRLKTEGAPCNCLKGNV